MARYNSHAGYKTTNTYDCVLYYTVKHSSSPKYYIFTNRKSAHNREGQGIGTHNNKHGYSCSLPVNIKKCVYVIEYMFTSSRFDGNCIKCYKMTNNKL